MRRIGEFAEISVTPEGNVIDAESWQAQRDGWLPSRDDLCYATKNRQDAVKGIAPNCDLFLVVTSDYSSNGMRLLELADELTGNARRIEHAAQRLRQI